MKKLYQKLLTLGLMGLLFMTTGNVMGQDLIITGVYDGPLSGGTPKGVELYVINAIPDLSLYGLGSANNGGGTNGMEFQLSGSATAGDFIHVTANDTEFD